MLKKIDIHEVLTIRHAIEKYRTQYCIMIITSVVDQGDNDLGYVMYTADKKSDLLSVPRSEYKGMVATLMAGAATESYPQIGNVVYHD